MPFRSLLATLMLLIAPLHRPLANNVLSRVLDYQPGTGASPGYDQTSAVLGSPSRVTPGDFGGPVDPFSPPWQAGQVLSLGAGGSLTVAFDQPVPNLDTHPYGLDFLVFGSAGFLIVNGEYTGGGITDGSLFGAAEGPTRVSVSTDGLSYYLLDPALAPTVDQWFPTDGAGDFSVPVRPDLSDLDFAGRDLAGIRELYAGSGGGTGFDIAWARSDSGEPVALSHIQYVRIDVLSDRAEIDALTAVPEPGVASLALIGALLLRVSRHPRSPATCNLP